LRGGEDFSRRARRGGGAVSRKAAKEQRHKGLYAFSTTVRLTKIQFRIHR